MNSEINFDDRMSVIIQNFFNILEDRDISATKYANDNHLDKSLLSKWKSNNTKMSIEHINQACSYFNISFNDLCYSNLENKKLSISNSGYKYDPIIAQQSINMNLYHNVYNNKNKVFILFFISLITLTIFNVLVSYFDINLSLFIMPILVYSGYLSIKPYILKKNYIINYLDDISYRIENNTNQYYRKMMIYKVLSILSIVISIVLFGLLIKDNNIIISAYGFLLFINLFVSLLSLFNVSKSFKGKLNDSDLNPFSINIIPFIFACFTCILIPNLFFLFNIKCIYLVLITILQLVLSFLYLNLLFTKYKEYNLVYSDSVNNLKRLINN